MVSHKYLLRARAEGGMHVQRACKPQIGEQMSGPEISYYEKTILGCGLWSGLDYEIKGFGPIMSNF